MLGRHVGRRADGAFRRFADVGRFACFFGTNRSAEIGYFDVAIGGEQDVARLDVAVDDALTHRHFERADTFENNFHHFANRQQSFYLVMRFERAARDIFHHHIVEAIFGAGVVNLNDVRVRQFADQPGFSKKAALLHGFCLWLAGVGRLVGDEHFDRNIAIGKRIMSQIDAGGRPLAKFFDDLVFADFFDQFEHGALGKWWKWDGSLIDHEPDFSSIGVLVPVPHRRHRR